MQNISDSCRICLKVVDKKVLLVKTPENYSKDYLSLLKECVPALEISYEDEMPKQICLACANEVLISYRLRKKAISSEKIMQSIFQRQKQEDNVHSKDIENLNSTIKQVLSSCGNVCDQCLNTGCLSTSAPSKITKIDILIPEISANHISDTPCRFCGSEQDTCNICTLDEEKSDISTLEITSISTAEILGEQINSNRTVTPLPSASETATSFECSECEKKFVTKSRLKKHIMTHSPDKPHHCKHCKWSFATQAELETHSLVNHSTVGRNECVYCQKTFKEKRLLRQHMITHKQQKRFSCRYCEKGFNLLHHLKNHEKIHENKSEFECDICFKKFLTKDRLLSHHKIHGDKNYRCNTCDKTFFLSSQLSQHEHSHQSKILYVCASCGLHFSEKVKFDRHRKTSCTENNNLLARETSMTKFVCLVCNLAFETVEELRNHMKVAHTNTHICPTCNKSFLKRSTLEGHIRSHSLRFCVCLHCQETFSRMDHLKSHITRRHKDIEEKNYKYSCPECSKRFLQSGELNIHLRTHSNSRPYVCTICNVKSFNQINQLKAHERLHSNEKPYICKVCNKAYHSASGLEQHLKSSHTKLITVERQITLSLQNISAEELEQGSVLTFDMNLNSK